MSVIPGRAKSGNHMLLPREYAALLRKQGGHCAICPSTPKTRRLHVDREHKTGRVRGLLCMRCNRFLTTYNSTPDVLRAAADYFERTA